MTTAFDLGARRRVHIVAIGGAAMSAIARYLCQLGHEVSGSDLRPSAMLTALGDEGIAVSIGHRRENIPDGCDAVAVSTAVRADNPEVVAAHQRGIPVLRRGEAMALIVATRPNAAVVTGTHGKTTTTSMLAAVLDAASWHPSYFIGGTPAGSATNARYDPAGEWIVVEGDESDHSFVDYPRTAAIVTNIEADHLDRWGDLDALVAGFAAFIDGASGPVVLCSDNDVLRRLAAERAGAVTYGFGEGARYRAVEYEATAAGSRIVVAHDGRTLGALALQLRGRDMAQNALGAAALAAELGVPWATITAALGAFEGVKRRFQHRSTIAGVDCFDDYAHTATEVAATLERAREGGWRQVVAVFQPHRYTRISRHWREFADAFVAADSLVVTGLDGAFEDEIAGVDGHLVVTAVLDAHPAMRVTYLPDWESLRDVPWRCARPGDLLITLGCGTITEAHDLWFGEAARREQRP